MNNRLKDFISIESISGLLLLGGALLALCISNSALYEEYLDLVHLPISIQVGHFTLNKPLLKWVNDGFMALFFLILTLEAKHHSTQESFTDRNSIKLALIAAVGGVVVPCLVYFLFTWSDSVQQKGWAVTIATDTAFVLAILSFFKKKISLDTKLFVITISIIDDIIAVLVLAVFFTPYLHFIPLLVAIILLLMLGVFNLLNIGKLTPYLLTGIALWLAIVEAGLHGTIAGVLVGLFIPSRIQPEGQQAHSPLKKLEHVLHPLVAFVVLPVFAFLNSEISFKEISLDDFLSRVTLGTVAGLFLGKQLGLMAFSYIPIKFNLVRLPHGLSWKRYYAICVLCGIGFTFSLFIGLLAFDNPALINQMKLGVIAGSILSGCLGAYILVKDSDETL